MSRPSSHTNLPGEAKRIAIVGHGAAGTLCAMHLIREAVSHRRGGDIEISIFDSSSSRGRGLAYSTDVPGHILNMRAATLGLDPDNCGSFVEWLQRTGSLYRDDEYPPRKTYGEYLTDEFEAHLRLAREHGVKVRIHAVEVTGYRPHGSGHLLQSLCGWGRYDVAVLCPGELSNLRFDHLRASPRYVASPWDRPAIDGIPRDSVVGVLGASLSAVDAAVQLIDNGHRGGIVFYSRRRRLPGVQPRPADYTLRVLTEQMLSEVTHGGTRELELSDLYRMFQSELHSGLGSNVDLDELIGSPADSQLDRLRADIVRAEAGGIALYHILDATASIAPYLWRALSGRAKSEFLRNGLSLWSMHRHSMPMTNARKLLAYGDRWGLEAQCGITRTQWHEPTWSFRFEAQHGNSTVTTETDWVINATGAEHDIPRSGHLLLTQMLRDGHIVACEHGGIEVDFETCAVPCDGSPDAPGSLYVAGPVTRGVHFYTHSIETTARNAGNIARAIIGSLGRADQRPATDDSGPLVIAAGQPTGREGQVNQPGMIVHDVETARGHRLQFKVDTERHAGLLWRWWTSDQIRPYWAIDHRLGRVGSPPFGPEAVAAYLRHCWETSNVEPYLVLESGAAVAYLETYACSGSPLADHPQIGRTDHGLHLMVGDPIQNRGLGLDIATHAIDWLFDTFPDMTQMVIDPSVDNAIAQKAAVKIGMREIDRVDLGYKRAALLAVSRDDWSALRSAAGR